MLKNIFLLIALLLFTISTQQVHAQAGALDNTFNNDTIQYGSCTGANNAIYASVIQSNNQCIIGGNFTVFNGTAVTRIARLNSGGGLDTTFKTGLGFNGNVNAIALQTNGDIVVGGAFTTYNGSPVGRLIRLMPDGNLDNTFQVGSGANSTVNTIAIQSDGNIIIGGVFTTYQGTQSNYIARLTPGGLIDTTFETGHGFDGSVNSICIQTNGKIVAGGSFSLYNSNPAVYIVRLNSNGTLDASFNANTGTGFNGYVNVVAIHSGGEILAGGSFTEYNGNSINYHLVRLDTTGLIDPTFSAVMSGTPSTVNTITVQPDNKILAGVMYGANSMLVRCNTNGSSDLSFYISSVDNNGSINAVGLQSTGKIIVAGQFTTYGNIVSGYIMRVDTNGLPDMPNANGPVYSTALQSNGEIIAAGGFSTYNEKIVNNIARITHTGLIDTAFAPTSGANGNINVAVIQSDGKVLIGGAFTDFNDTARNYFARLDTNGALDPLFKIGTGFNQPGVNALAIQGNGQIIAGGNFTAYAGKPINYLVRINSDGSIDTTFNIGLGANAPVDAISIQNDGKIIAGGSFSVFNGDSSIYSLVRLNTNGSVDSTFHCNCGGSVATIALQNNGKIVIGGGSFVMRINSDGSVDNSFITGTGANGPVYTTSIMSDGKIIIGGRFTSYNGARANHIARLNTNGKLDTHFNQGTGFDTSVTTTTLQGDQGLIVGGDFNFYNGVPRNYLARLLNNSIDIDSLPILTYCSDQSLSISYVAVGNYNPGNKFIVQISDGSGSFTSPVNIGSADSTGSGTISATIPGNINTGTQYRIRIVSTSPPDTSNDNGVNIAVNFIPVQNQCLITVDSTSTFNTVVWDKPATSFIDSFFIYHETAPNSNIYKKIASVPYDSLSEYNDYTSDPNGNTNAYKISTLSTCNTESALSEYHSTIFLTDNGNGNLSWLPYAIENTSNPVTYYRIYRDNFSNGNFVVLNDTISGSSTAWTDVGADSFPNAKYVADVNWGISCDPTRALSTTRSNVKHRSSPAGINQVESGAGLSIYPNPASQYVTLSFAAPVHIKELKILDMPGKIVYRETGTVQQQQTQQLNIEQLAEGVYMVYIETDLGKVVRKLIIQKT